MNQDKTIYLLVIDDSSNLTESVSNIMRNAGQAVRADRIESDEDLKEAFGKQEWDLIIARPASSSLSASDALGIVHQAKLDIPLILIADEADEATIDKLIEEGARDEISLSRPKRLEHTLLREAYDVRQRRALSITEKSLQEANDRAQALVTSSRDAITYVHEGMYIYANDSYLELFGYSSMEEFEGLPILDMVKTDEHGKFKQFLRDYVQGKTAENSLDVTGIKTDGSEFNVTMEFTPAFFEGEPCTQIIIRIQAADKELEQRLSDMSKMDLLTGAYNRPYLLQALQQLSGKKGLEGAVLAISPDHYRKVRDELGIAASDELLSSFSELLRQALPAEKDFIARFEGDIFTALLHDISQADAEEFSAKLCQQIGGHVFSISGKSTTTPCSIGIGIYDETLQDHQEVINRAEKALGEAKELGGNRAHLYVVDKAAMAEKERLAKLDKQIRAALKQNRLQLLFQPIVSITGDNRKNYEVFVRMQDEEGNTLLPKEFLPAAENCGLMGAVDRWILAHAIKSGVEKQRSGSPVVTFVKLSNASLHDEKFLPWLGDLLKALKCAPNSLVISVSEGIASNNIKALQALLNGLQSLQVSLALDHVGTTEHYEKLVQQCKAAFLKVDSSIICNLGNSKEVQEKVKGITALAAEGNKKVIASGVEDPHALAAIYSTGVDYIQGYFLQEPAAEMNYDFDSM